ncbi:unnamed protein product [Chondrus crispus]|uniref:Uncharacterized protein n=1 Tax=Chondrus crispus TaxID=2769 RepID=R7QNR3_CHOCR|nr:unnamed protein product [Chondrus crispus]CDF39000.1 unnamed protein product [Chondrus crispus]|eukprot:XP_005718905.1 unnamed protein product [Chondrus crispus]
MADESVPDNPVVITTCIALERNVNVTWLKEVVLPRILKHPRFSSVVIEGKEGKLRFESVPDFVPQNEKLMMHQFDVQHVGGEDKSNREREKIFQDRLSELMTTPLDRERPLWKVTLFPQWSIVDHDESVEKECCMVVVRVHHSISDGIGLVKYFTSEIIDKTSQEEQSRLLVVPERQFKKLRNQVHSSNPEKQQVSPTPAVTEQRHTTRNMRICVPEPGLLQRGWEFVEDVYLSSVRMLFTDPVSVFTRSTIQREKVCALMPPSSFTVQMLKNASRVFGVTINDLLYTAVAGASRLYLKEHGDNPDELKHLRCAIPFNEHALDSFSLSDVSNVFAIIALNLHVDEEDRMKRFEVCVRTLRRAKRSNQLVLLMGLIQLVARMPRFPRKAFWRYLTRATSLLFTNVPGPREAVHIGGVKVSSLHFFAPADGHAGVVLGMFSYMDKIAMGVAGDKGRISNPQRFVELLSSEIQLLLDISKAVN